MVPVSIVEMGTSPSCLAIDAAGKHMYSANETDRVGPDKEGTVASFAIDRSTGHLRQLNAVRSGGAGPTYVSVHPGGRFLFVANYFGGSASVLPIRPDGSLAEPSAIVRPKGTIGPTHATNAPPGSFAISGHDRTHAHMILSDPSGQFVMHADLGLDAIFVWRFNASNGTLQPAERHKIALPPGDGPRHFHFHPNGRVLYSIQEEGSNIAVFNYASATGGLTHLQTIATLPKGFVGSNFCSEILVSHDGRFVYAGNRLHDSIAILAVGATGELTYCAEEWTRGNYPRSFTFDPTGRYLYCCNQRSDNVTVFRVDRTTGLLKFADHYAAVGNPSHLVFWDSAMQT